MSLVLALATRLRVPPWLIEGALILILIAGFALYERHKGAAACERADAALATEQEAHNRDLKAQGTTTVFQEAHDYHDAVNAPVAHPVHVRLCPPSREVPASSPSGRLSDGGASLRGPDHTDVVQSDPGPELQMIGKQADAQVRELKHYILNVCSKR